MSYDMMVTIYGANYGVNIHGLRCERYGLRRCGSATWSAEPKRLELRLVCTICPTAWEMGSGGFDSQPVVPGLRGSSSSWCGWGDAKVSFVVNRAL